MKTLLKVFTAIVIIFTISACSNEKVDTKQVEQLETEIRDLKVENSKLKTENAKLQKKIEMQQRERVSNKN